MSLMPMCGATHAAFVYAVVSLTPRRLKPFQISSMLK